MSKVSTMLELRKFVAPEFIFGPGALSLVGRYLANFGAKKVLVVTDQGVIDAGWAGRLTDLLSRDGLDFALFSTVSANPRDIQVMAGADFYHQEKCDIIVAVGGGSPMDCAKGIGIVSTNHGNILDYEGIDNVDIPGPPLICIPTTAGTAADVSQFAIISATAEQRKIAIISKTMVPDVALIDPETTLTMNSHLTACTGMDALVHAIEAYVSTANSPILDLHALEAIRLICANLPKVLAAPNDLALRANLTLASLQAGLAFSNASLGAVHAMAHSLGGLLDLPHGECNAILLDHVVGFNFAEAGPRYGAIAQAMGLEVAGLTDSQSKSAILAGIASLKKSVGIHSTLGNWGATSADIPVLAQKALADPCMVTNPRLANQRDIEVIYEEAL
ncbi:MAG: alcohol dehydrogenase-like regulatory protein ErcA [Desulforhopalus sp.]|nr:alcohol dehydrogenase-like regulatory protein ErcA [Desulforhopalus sp.]